MPPITRTVECVLSDPKKVLVAEDEILITLLIEDTLADLGFRAVSVASQQKASDALEGQERFELAILDYHLKDGTSLGLANKLAEQGVPIIVCSGSMAVDELTGALQGATFLAKPSAQSNSKRQ